MLAKESVILRDRQQLARHVEFLQRQLVTSAVSEGRCDGLTDSERDKLNVYISSHCVTDDMLQAVSTDHQQQRAVDDDVCDSDDVVS